MNPLVAVVGFLCVAAATAADTTCIKLSVDGMLTVNATEGSNVRSVSFDLKDPEQTVNQTCTNVNTSVSMTVTFNSTTTWVLTFTNSNNKVALAQNVTFVPATVFNDSALTNETVEVPSTGDLTLSTSNASFLCSAEQVIPFSTTQEGNVTYSISLSISNLTVQAFGLKNDTFSPAEECDADKGQTTAPSPATTEPATTVGPTVATFVLNGSAGVCFKLQAELAFAVEYNTTANKMEMSKRFNIPQSAEVTGTCSNGTSPATMTIGGDFYNLTITETISGDQVTSAITLDVTLDPENFPNATKANQTVTFTAASQPFLEQRKDTYYKCTADQTLPFKQSNTKLFAAQVKLQAFNLKNGSFTGQGEECSLDPGPYTPAPSPGDNTYVVKSTNVTCIVLKGDISLSNITYTTKDGKQATADTVNIPTMNETSGNVKYSGNCSLENGNAQQLVITFNGNWTVALTFARGGSKASSMLQATSSEYSLRDIEFVYYLETAFFPNISATQQGEMHSAAHMNITGDFLKGAVNGGSYKCDAMVTESLDGGVQFETTNLQYKAFNNDNSTTFSDAVTECPADNQSNSIVPIAVGAALAGLVVIVLIAYLIGRRRSRRQGYESV